MTTEEPTTDLTLYKLPKRFETRFVKGHKHITDILKLIAPQRRHYIFINAACVDVIDSCNDILKSVQVAIEKKKVGANDKEVIFI